MTPDKFIPMLQWDYCIPDEVYHYFNDKEDITDEEQVLDSGD